MRCASRFTTFIEIFKDGDLGRDYGQTLPAGSLTVTAGEMELNQDRYRHSREDWVEQRFEPQNHRIRGGS